MRQNTRKIINYISLFLFPITLNYFSPYISMDGAIAGVISGSILVFITMFLTGFFFGRSWCAWVCPMAGLGELTTTINARDPNKKKLTKIRFTIFTFWFMAIVIFFILAGGIRGIDPFRLSESIVSVDMPVKYLTYYIVLAIFFMLNVSLGKRGACHTICWMSPFLATGYQIGKILRIHQLRIKAESSKCIDCKLCDKVCPMSIKVSQEQKKGSIETSDCILCGQCIDICPKSVLGFGVRKGV